MSNEIKKPNDGHEVPLSGGTELKDGGAPVQEIDAEAAEQVQAEAGTTIQENIDKEDESLKDQLKGNELSGQVLKPGHFARGETSGVSVIGAKARTLMSTYETDDTSVQVSDVDKSEKLAEIAQKEYAKIEASFTMESTPVIQSGEDSQPDRVNEEIYPESSMITTESIGGVHTKAPHGSPRTRENGKIFIRGKDELIIAGNTYLRSTNNGTGHDAKKRKMQGENVLLNVFDEYHNLKTEFRHVRPGLYVILGINPLCGTTQPGANAWLKGVRRKGEKDGEVADCTVPVTVAGHEFFRVREITPTVDDVASAIGDFAEFLCADETKHMLAKYEAIHSTILRAEPQNEVSNLFNDFVEWAPEFKRGTLLVADRSLISGKFTDTKGNEWKKVDLSCFNNPADIVELFDTMNQSEIALPMIYLNILRIKEQLKYFRGMEGKMLTQPFWSGVFKADPSKEYGTMPTMKNIFASKASSRAWDTPAKVIYGLGLFWREMDALKQEFEGSKLFGEYCAKIGVMKQTIDALCEAMCIGKVTDTKATSEDIVKVGSKARLVVGFNPNDVIDYSTSTRLLTHIKDSGETYAVEYYVPYICTGYVIAGADMQHAPQRKFYDVAPKWIKALVTAFSDKEFLERHFLRLSSSGVLQSDSPIFYWWDSSTHKLKPSSSAPFLPWALDTYNTTWMDIVLAHAIGHADNENLLACESAYYNDGLTRFNKLLEKIDANNVLMADRISLVDFYKRVSENDLLFPNPNYTDMPDYEKLPYDVEQENPFAHQIGALGKIKNASNANASVALFAPTITRRRVSDLRMYECISYNHTDKSYDSIMEFLADCVAPAGSNPVIELIPLEGSEAFIPFFYNTAIPVMFRNRFVKDEKGKIRIDVINEHADEKLLSAAAREPAKLLFGKDGFEWVTHYDYFIPIIHKGVEIARESSVGASEVEIATQLQDYTLSLAGALEVPFTNQVSAASGKAYEFVKQAPLIRLPNNGKGRNTFYADINNDGSPKTAVEYRVRNMKADSLAGATLYESKYISKTAIPSLYGYTMKLFDYVADYFYKRTGSELTISNGIRGVTEDAKVVDATAANVLKIKSKEILGMTPTVVMYQRQTVFAPELVSGYQEYVVEATDLASVRAKFELENVMPNDAMFHDRSVIYSFAYGDFDTGVSGVTEVAKMPYIFNIANLPVSKDVFSHVASYVATTDAMTKVHQVRIGKTVKALSKTQNEIFEDAIYRKGLNFRLPIIPELCTFDVVWDSLGANDPTITPITLDALVEPAELRSRAYCNDYRDYVVQPSIESLHDFWEKTNVSVSRFAAKYFKGE